ncbi:dimethyladenosine transferase 2, mitochondrial [Bombina bombina]|uniref:dimethyladenosine transferase 2, mitochondrial n=1 Tax=Bombina bombina TaxID=8345 RepID=UPI00235AFE08|nr:dimethyladenosine transferase 2, mitochondrial [Bombina bombina]
MSSLSSTKMGLCMLLFRPLTGTSMLCCHKRSPTSASSSNAAVSTNLARGMSAMAGQRRRHPSAMDFLDLKEVKTAESCKEFRRFIADPALAQIVLKSLKPWDQKGASPLIIECNPGPGIVTRMLLDTGARVAALESNTRFHPSLKALQNGCDGQLEVVHCDFFRLDPLGQGTMCRPAMYSDELFESLGQLPVPWTEDVPIKVFGFLPHKNERNMLWKNIFSLYERISIYQYGRVQLNMFMSESQYKKLISEPGDMRNYMALSVLYQASCDIELLHMEPWSSFMIPSRFRGMSIPKSAYIPNDHLCLVQITPQRNLFNQNFTSRNATSFICMIRQCLAKRKAILADRLNSWDPGNGHKLLSQLQLPDDILAGNIYPQQYKSIFEAMQHSEDFSSLLYNEIYDHDRCGF